MLRLSFLQVGDAVLERNEDIQISALHDDKLEESKESLNPNLNSYSSSDEDDVIITIGETPQKKLASEEKKIGKQLLELPIDAQKSNLSDNEVSRSDSMIPLVGDSILLQDVTMDI